MKWVKWVLDEIAEELEYRLIKIHLLFQIYPRLDELLVWMFFVTLSIIILISL